MRSLRTRLLVYLLSGLLLVSGIGAVGLYQRALAEADRVFDDQLRETAVALRDRSFMPTSPVYGEREAAADLVVQIFSLTGARMYSSQRYSTIPGRTTLGFSTVDTPDARWRVFGLETAFNVIQVAQPMRVRETRAARLALGLLVPLTLMLPVLGVIVWITVGRALRPLRGLAAEVSSRPAGEGAPLPDAQLPTEVRPLVAALNDLLARLGALRERERRFIADAAHELRTPLTALRLQLSGLDYASESERRESIAALSAGIQRAARLVEQMLALARQEAPADAAAMQRLSLAELAREVVAELLPAADARGLELGVSELDAGWVIGDAEGLRTLLRNLVDNALRYAPAGSVVDVRVELDADSTRISVVDQGPGIPVENRERIFDRFYRVPGSAAGGSGLGLAIVKRIAEAHSAQIELSNGPGDSGLTASLRFVYSSERRASDG